MRRDIANHPTTILIIISLLMLASCGQRQTLKEPMQVTRSQPAVRHLYEALTFGQEFDDILIERIDDTLLYAQLWPSEKFKIENRHNDFFVPLVVTTDGDSCLSMVRNKLLDPDIIHRINSGDCRIVLLSHLPIIEQLECVNPPGVGVVINFCRVENDSGCNVELFEDYSDGTIDLALGSKLTYPGGGTVDCGVTIDETIPAVRLTTAIKPAYDGSVGPQLNAGGTVTFTPPADEFELSIDGDRYRVVLGRDSVTVKPLTVCDHILSPAAQARLPRDVFGV
ncbi:MAG: hypothetical protein KKA42_05825, partial [candidate division Zixibacteria bacterium]|nr:hypothetical protein [candidate division Zixibacteria bacterium]